MRKLYLYMALFLLALAAGCQREEIDSIDSVESDDDVMEVYATIEDIDAAQTKTYLSGTDVYWSSGDKIAVFNGNLQRKLFNVDHENIGSKDATFYEDEKYSPEGSDTRIANNIAYYPFCDVTCAADGSSYTLGNLTLPATQSYVEGSVGLGAFPMVAVTENTDDVNFRFQNICGVMQFQLTGYGFVKSVSVKGNNDEILSGPAVVTAGYGKEPSIAMSAEGGKVVTLDCGEGGVELNETTPVSFFIVLPPVQFEGGFTITVEDTWGGRKEYSTTKKNPVGRSNGLRMPSKEYVGERPVQEGDYVDEYGVNHGQGVEIDGVVWAPVNCGYHATDFKYGKLYQWGRKYGQGYESDVHNVPGPVALFEGQAKEKEDCFYTIGSAPYDWLDYPCDNLWNQGNEENPVKSEYDPCPDGWRVPTYATLKQLTQNHSSWTENSKGEAGYWFSGAVEYATTAPQLFLPASCYRNNDGSIYVPFSSGHYWSSGLNVFFDQNGVGSNAEYCVRGHSIRCVKDDSVLITVNSIVLDKSSITLGVGGTVSLTATITPSNANHQSAYWWSEDESVATVDSDGMITAVAEGSTTITAMAGMQTVTCTVTVVAEGCYVDEYGLSHGLGIEIDGVVWAPVNCGYKAATADSKGFPYGKLYQWGRKYGQGYDDSDESYPSGDNVIAELVSPGAGQSEENKDKFYNYLHIYDWSKVRVDNLWNLGSEDSPMKSEYDPCPEGWRIPTQTELNALVSNRSSWLIDGGQNGYFFSGANQYQENAPSLFLPAAGYQLNGGDTRGVRGDYWSSKSNYTRDAFGLYFLSNEVTVTSSYRKFGYSVRCVRDDAELVPVTSVTLTNSSLTLSAGATATITATIAPSNANHQSALWWSEDESVATVDSEGKITAVAEGTTIITAMAGMQVATCEVTVNQPTTGEPQEGDYVDEYGVNHGQGVEIDGVVWAPVNCGYKAPTADSKGFPYGKLYQWGRKYGQGYDDSDESYPSGDDFIKGPVSPTPQSEGSAHKFIYFLNNGQYNYPYDWANPHKDKLWNSGTETKPVKTEYDPCPTGWRVPLHSELETLCGNHSSWVANESGVMGYWFCGSTPYGDGVMQIFLPAAGSRSGIVKNAKGKNRDVKGSYYSSRYYRDSSEGGLGAYLLSFDSTSVSVGYNLARSSGLSVRCVRE